MEIEIRQGVASDAAHTTPLILSAAQTLLTSILDIIKIKQPMATFLTLGNWVVVSMASTIIG